VLANHCSAMRLCGFDHSLFPMLRRVL
jgi:hypothetical protein